MNHTFSTGRHVAPASFDTDRLEYLSRVGRLTRPAPARHLADRRDAATACRSCGGNHGTDLIELASKTAVAS